MIGEALKSAERPSMLDSLVERYKPETEFDIPLPQGEVLRFKSVPNIGSLKGLMKEATAWALKVKNGRLGQFSMYAELPGEALGYAFFMHKTMVGAWEKSETQTEEDGSEKTVPIGEIEAVWPLTTFCDLAMNVAFLFDFIRRNLDASQVKLQRAELAVAIESEKKE